MRTNECIDYRCGCFCITLHYITFIWEMFLSKVTNNFRKHSGFRTVGKPEESSKC